MSAENTDAVPLAVVAGASGAIGGAVVRALLAANWAVIGTYRSNRPKPIAGVTWVCFDGTTEEGTTELYQTLAAERAPLKAVISCLGVPSSKRRIASTEPEEFDAVFVGNVTSVVRLWQNVAERARLAAAGVVLLGSDTTATLRPGNGAYSVAKAGLEALCITLATEEAEYGVRVNLVAPSLTDSPLAEAVLALKGITNGGNYYDSLPWSRPLTPHEVGSVAVEIATARHWRYASGQVVRLAVRG